MKKKTVRNILVIDDDPNMIRILEKWLQNAGCRVWASLNGTEGIETAQREKPSLILLDLMLPDIGGVEVARRLREDQQTTDIPVLFMTVTMGVEIDKGDETMEIDGRLYRVFAKPLHRAKLLSEIRKSINRRLNKNPSSIEGS